MTISIVHLILNWIIFGLMQRFQCFSCIRPSTVSSLFTPNAQLRLEPRLGLDPNSLFFFHPSAESGRLSSDSLSAEFRSLALLYVHADHFINDCAYGSIGFISLDMSCECILCIYVAFVTEGHMVEQFKLAKCVLPTLNK